MTSYEKEKLLVEARTFAIAAPLLMPMIERYKKSAIDRLMAKHRDGDTKYETLVAELAVLTRFESEFLQKENIYRTLEEKSK